MTSKSKLRENCFSALTCLYLAVDKQIADDVNEKVKAYIRELELREPSIDRGKPPNESR